MKPSFNNTVVLMLCLISMLGRFALDSYLPSFPAITTAFSVTQAETERTLTFYLLGFGLSQFIYGPLSDRFGRKKVLLGSFLIFITGNLLCAFSVSITQLTFFRFISGVGGGASGVLNRTIAADYFKGPEFVKAWSYTTSTLVLTLILAPLIGSTLQIHFGWRANFILMAALISLTFILVCKFLPESNTKPDLNGLKTKKIIVNYKSLLTNKSFVLSLLCYIFAFSGLITFFQMSPFLFIQTLGLSTTSFAWLSLIVAFSYLIGGVVVNQLSQTQGIKRMMFMGIVLLIIGGIGMLCDLENISVAIIMLPAVIFIIGARMVIPNATASALLGFTTNKGSASALIGSFQMIGTALVSFIISTFNCTSQLPLGVAFFIFGLASIICFLLLFNSNELQNRVAPSSSKIPT